MTTTTTSKRFPGEVDATFPDVFNIKAMPPQPMEKKPGQLPEDKIRQFFEEGFLVVDSFFEKSELDACLVTVEGLVDEIADKLYKGGKIKNLYKECGVYQRLAMLEKEWPGANILLIKSGKFPKAFQELWSNPLLLNLVEQIIGPNIAGHPVWNLRCKVPQNEATVVPWHQDAAYMDNRAYGVLQLTAWIPLLDATKENGCMEVAAKGHLKGKVARHTSCWRDTWYIQMDDEEMTKTLGVDQQKDVKVCPVPFGGLLLLNNLLPHRSLPNLSDKTRWSLDLRWQRPDKPIGFYDLKEGVLMRTKEQPDLKIDWDTFNSVDRDAVSTELVAKDHGNAAQKDEFCTLVQGPWMKKWEMLHTNRHTDALTDDQAALAHMY